MWLIGGNDSMVKKTCSKCNLEKDISSFYRLSNSKDGHRPDCSDCCKKFKQDRKKLRPVRDRCDRLGSSMMQRIDPNDTSPSNKCYRDNNVVSKIGRTGKEVADYLYENFYKEIESTIKEGKQPSLDRIDSSGDYSPDNIRIIPLEDNVRDGIKNAVKVTSKSVTVINELTGDRVEYKSVSEASRALGIKRETIIRNRDNGTVSKAGYRFLDTKSEGEE